MEKRVCTRCLLREMAETDGRKEMLEKYRKVLKLTDRASEEVFEERLAVCKSCDRLNAGTCMACGCYVELRAAVKGARCPKKKW